MEEQHISFLDNLAPKYVLDFARTPGVRLSSEEWHAVLAALSMCFSFTASQYRQLPKSVQEKFTEIE